MKLEDRMKYKVLSYQDFRDYVCSGIHYYSLPREYEYEFRKMISKKYGMKPTTFNEWINRLAEYKIDLAHIKKLKRAPQSIRV